MLVTAAIADATAAVAVAAIVVVPAAVVATVVVIAIVAVALLAVDRCSLAAVVVALLPLHPVARRLLSRRLRVVAVLRRAANALRLPIAL